MESSCTKPIRLTSSSNAAGVAARSGSERSPCAPIRSRRACAADTRGGDGPLTSVFGGKLKLSFTLEITLAAVEGVAEPNGAREEFERGRKVFGLVGEQRRVEPVVKNRHPERREVEPRLMLAPRQRSRLVERASVARPEHVHARLGVRLALDLLHAEEGLARDDAAAPRQGEVE